MEQSELYLENFQTSVRFHVNMLQVKNKNFTLAGHAVYCVPELSSKMIEVNIFAFTISFQQELNIDGSNEL